MHLQGADAGSEIDDAGEISALEPGHERMHVQAQFQIEHHRAVFHQNIAIAGAPIS